MAMFTTSAHKLRQLVPLIVRQPDEFRDRVRAKLESRAERMMPVAYDAVTVDDGLHALDAELGMRATEILNERELVSRLRVTADRIQQLRDEGPFAPAHNGDAALGSLVYYACRALRPRVVIETGVAYGVTSACILTALAGNGAGRLWSIDLPPLGKAGDAYVGALVPEELRSRWQLNRGASRRLLPGILASLRHVDLFVHDSLHTRANMLWEFETVWPALTPGALLVADDAGDNSAFAEFVARVQPAFSVVIREKHKQSLLGILRKPL
jgi:predicted O-methyltransferase YrrM